MTALWNDKLAPGFLVAPPSMGDPNFSRTLVLMAMHDETGSLGFIINRPHRLMLHALLKDLEIAPVVADRAVLAGGPVNGGSGYVLYEHAPGKSVGAGVEVTPGMSLSPSKDVLVMAAQGKLEGRFELVLGYAGWGPGQLRHEIERGSWLYADFDAQLVMDVGADARWDEAYQRLGVSPMDFINVPGGAQA